MEREDRNKEIKRGMAGERRAREEGRRGGRVRKKREREQIRMGVSERGQKYGGTQVLTQTITMEKTQTKQ